MLTSMLLRALPTGLSLPDPFPHRGDSNPESMEDSEPLELRQRVTLAPGRGSSMREE